MSVLLEILDEIIARVLASHRGPGTSHHLVDEGLSVNCATTPTVCDEAI